MKSLELKIPPPLVALLCILLMWYVQGFYPLSWLTSVWVLPLAIALALAGIAIATIGAAAFRRAHTTVNPLHPEQTSQLVTGGIYQYTRNPMYLGMALVLLAIALYMADVSAFLGVALFVRFIGRYQIEPEESMLLEKFGDEFAAYQAHVRRWL
ncbi:methyltransferase family protein [Pseudohongiella sp.]|uniref:Steroid 5-alpha reductase C-terminal domain-containing protein n=1 Tax=marine sediment metagenome TaxID=412755 RepID=A0A0F9YJA8_9ZZZZ|nr:isoprenylcysteine carboxylmethyltransferase family protein [Pseudohongiella sp.]HDZ07458.1 isoprenylcysteine carboxylmethyltransferase family protein [Pseudohongiella sp.]